MALAIIQARMDSARFPGKVLASLYGKPLLRHVIDRVSRAILVEDVLVATAGGNAAAIVGHAAAWGVEAKVFPAATEEDVLGRFVAACEGLAGGAWIVRVCGDNPLVVPEAIDDLLVAASSGGDYLGYRFPAGTPAISVSTGYFAEAVRVAALKRLDDELETDDPRREHVTLALYAQPERYACRWLPVPEWYWHAGCPPQTAIDTPDDLRRVEGLLADWAEIRPEERLPFQRGEG